MAGRKLNPRPTYETQVITEARIRLGYSQEVISELAGLSLIQYQRIETGKRPFYAMNLRQGLILCKLLEIDPMELMFGQKNMPFTSDRS